MEEKVRDVGLVAVDKNLRSLHLLWNLGVSAPSLSITNWHSCSWKEQKQSRVAVSPPVPLKERNIFPRKLRELNGMDKLGALGIALGHHSSHTTLLWGHTLGSHLRNWEAKTWKHKKRGSWNFQALHWIYKKSTRTHWDLPLAGHHAPQ